MGFGPAYVAHISPIDGWYSKDFFVVGSGRVCGLYNFKLQKAKKKKRRASGASPCSSALSVRCGMGIHVRTHVHGKNHGKNMAFLLMKRVVV